MTSRRPVAALGAVTRMPVLRSRVAETVAVDMAEIPWLARQYPLMTAGAVMEAQRDMGGSRRRCLARCD